MIEIMENWFPEIGNYLEWLDRTRKKIHSEGYRIMNERSGYTFMGGEWVIFSVKKEKAHA